MDELKVLGACLHDRSAFKMLRRHMDEKDLSDKGQVVYKEICLWYDTDAGAQSCDSEVIQERLAAQHPKHADLFRSVVQKCVPVSGTNITATFLNFKKKAVSSSLIQALAADDTAKAEALSKKYQELVLGESRVHERDGKIFKGASSETLVQSVRPENLMRLHPQVLNDAIGGGLPRGAHVLVFAQPEVGKSLFSINIASGFLHDGRSVLYIGNEDPAELMLLRFKSRLSGMPRRSILDDCAKADELASKHGFDNLTFAALSPGSMHDVEYLVDEHKPDILVCDQLPNLQAPNLSKVEKLEWLAQQMRNLCKSRNIVGISVCQAADSAKDKLVLDMGDVFFSNVAIQAQVDVMIGIGMDKTAEVAQMRMLSLCKNKLNGNHQPVQVHIIPDLSKVRG